ncbi:MAG: hypothetical protein ABSF08_00120 [Candidatus Cybelea sp.]
MMSGGSSNVWQRRPVVARHPMLFALFFANHVEPERVRGWVTHRRE